MNMGVNTNRMSALATNCPMCCFMLYAAFAEVSRGVSCYVQNSSCAVVCFLQARLAPVSTLMVGPVHVSLLQRQFGLVLELSG